MATLQNNFKLAFLVLFFGLAWSLPASPVRDYISAKSLEYIGQDQIVPVAYLESTGTQYISIPYSANHGTKANIVAAFPDIFTQQQKGYIFGQRGGGYYFCLRLWEEGSTYGRLSYGWRKGWTNTSQTPYLVDDKDHFYSISLDYYIYNGMPRGRCICDGYRLTESTYVGEFGVAADEFCVFNLYGYLARNNIRIRCAAFTISEDDEIICDLIPVRVGNEGFMLDLVSGELYGNQGTGDFIIGPDL